MYRNKEAESYAKMYIHDTDYNQYDDYLFTNDKNKAYAYGKLHSYKNRDELKAVIESYGGKVTGSVTKNTSYLINNDTNSTTAKNKTAKELGVLIITEEEFNTLIEPSHLASAT